MITLFSVVIVEVPEIPNGVVAWSKVVLKFIGTTLYFTPQ